MSKTQIQGFRTPNQFQRSHLSGQENIAQRVLYEDNHLLVLNKPVGLATMGVGANEESLFTLAKRYIKQKYQKPGEVYLGVVSRLDLPVSGIIVFARTSKAANRLNEQFSKHSVKKIYHALVEGLPAVPQGELIDVICEDKKLRKLWISNSPNSLANKRFDPKEAKLHYQVLERFSKTALVEVELLTGRKHQIRLQMSHLGHPIIGDGKYGARPIPQSGICLHAYRLSFIHPTTRIELDFHCDHPDWSRWGS